MSEASGDANLWSRSELRARFYQSLSANRRSGIPGATSVAASRLDAIEWCSGGILRPTGDWSQYRIACPDTACGENQHYSWERLEGRVREHALAQSTTRVVFGETPPRRTGNSSTVRHVSRLNCRAVAHETDWLGSTACGTGMSLNLNAALNPPLQLATLMTSASSPEKELCRSRTQARLQRQAKAFVFQLIPINATT